MVVGRIWKLSDVDQDGMLDSDEFALAMHLINIKMEGHDLPSTLPEHLIQKFVDITQQCFASLPQVNFPKHNLNFH